MDDRALAVVAELEQAAKQFEADMQRIVEEAMRKIWDRYLTENGDHRGRDD